VIVRLAPFPSGPLHIGNAKPAIINDYYARKYKGKFLLVIDDTIGSKEKSISKEAYNLIPEGLKFLNIKIEKTYCKSDRLQMYYPYAEKLIKLNKAYVCTCPQEELKKNRINKTECTCRKKLPEQNLKDWKKMFSSEPGSATLRIKTSMSHPNPAFRDRVIFRISGQLHPRTKARVWPLLDFSWAIDDHLLNITHIIRGKELMIESEMEKYIWDILKWPHPEIIHTGLVQIQGVKLSKSKAKKEVESGEYFGWDDPRTWSLQSLQKRGIKPEAIRKFCLSFGLNQNEITVPIDSLYAENRKLIEKTSKRYFCIEEPEKITIKNTKKTTAVLPSHPNNQELGTRKMKTSSEFYIEKKDNPKKDRNYRLMHLFNFRNNIFLSNKYDPKLNTKQIHWLPVSRDLIKIEIIMENGKKIKAIAEPDIKKVKIGDTIQFERKFFATLQTKTTSKLIFWYCHT
ncbi:MAG: glutamate--tRNA ligase, partial [Nanoarchaeota archaeon]|nr:glutamate--tRNA ligase [Nanoarchaeota archaeon]